MKILLQWCPHIIDPNTSSYEEVSSEQAWKNAMVEYKSIMKNDIWEILLKPIKNSMIYFKWLYIVKHERYVKYRSTEIGF
jgi:hypothetical protein